MNHVDRTGWPFIRSLYAILLAGTFAGFAFVLFKIGMAALIGNDMFYPLRAIGAMIIGDRAFDTEFPLSLIAAAGLVVHMSLSLLYAAGFWVVATTIPPVRRNYATLLVTASGMGFLLWIVNLYIFAPLLFPWFTVNQPLVELVARVVFFGLPIGLILSRNLMPKENTNHSADSQTVLLPHHSAALAEAE